jgi:N-acetyl-anhydromuramyl-L-alanine amidase AmpD
MPDFSEANGWMPGVEYVPTVRVAPDSYGIADGNMWPRAIVHHVMQGYFAGAKAMMQETTFKAPSWHFSVARDGRIMQHASIWTPTMHAGLTSTSRDVGEPVDSLRSNPGQWLAAWQAKNPNTWAIGIEHEGFSKPETTGTGKRVDDYIYGPGNPWPEALIEASIRVQRWCWQRCQWLIDLPRGSYADWNTADSRFLTHAMIDPEMRPLDPGPEWDAKVWHRIVNAVLAVPEPPRPPAPPVEPVPPAPAPVPKDETELYREAYGAAHTTISTALTAALEATKDPWN